MKKAKKAILLVLCAALLVGASVAGTLAYLTSKTEKITNTFTVGKVKIELDEAQTDAYGKKQGTDRITTAGGNEYTLVPGLTYHKNPTITLEANSEDCYLFVKVKEPDAAAREIIQYTLNLADWGKYTHSDFTNIPEDETVYYRVCNKSATATTFYLLKNPETTAGEYVNGGFKVEDTVTAEQLDELVKGEKTISNLEFTAYAIQKTGFTAAEAWSEVSKLDTTTP